MSTFTFYLSKNFKEYFYFYLSKKFHQYLYFYSSRQVQYFAHAQHCIDRTCVQTLSRRRHGNVAQPHIVMRSDCSLLKLTDWLGGLCDVVSLRSISLAANLSGKLLSVCRRTACRLFVAGRPPVWTYIQCLRRCCIDLCVVVGHLSRLCLSVCLSILTTRRLLVPIPCLLLDDQRRLVLSYSRLNLVLHTQPNVET